MGRLETSGLRRVSIPEPPGAVGIRHHDDRLLDLAPVFRDECDDGISHGADVDKNRFGGLLRERHKFPSEYTAYSRISNTSETCPANPVKRSLAEPLPKLPIVRPVMEEVTTPIPVEPFAPRKLFPSRQDSDDLLYAPARIDAELLGAVVALTRALFMSASCTDEDSVIAIWELAACETVFRTPIPIPRPLS